MSRAIVILATGAFWAVMMAALVKREILPYFEYQAPPTYRSMFRDRQEPELERRIILLAGERRGAVETLYRPLPGGSFRLATRLDMRIHHPKLGHVPIKATTVVDVDATYQLLCFDITSELQQGLTIRLSGNRRGEKLHVTYDALLFKGTRAMDFPKDMTLADGFVAYYGGTKLAVGKKWRVQTFEMSGAEPKAIQAYASVERRETRSWRGRDVPAYVVEIRKQATSDFPWQTLWVSEDGTVLEEQMTYDQLLYNIVLESKEKLTPDEAIAWERNEGAPKRETGR